MLGIDKYIAGQYHARMSVSESVRRNTEAVVQAKLFGILPIGRGKRLEPGDIHDMSKWVSLTSLHGYAAYEGYTGDEVAMSKDGMLYHRYNTSNDGQWQTDKLPYYEINKSHVGSGRILRHEVRVRRRSLFSH